MIAGGYGSGKTEITVNLALQMARRGTIVRLADLDIVNPYFRCREACALLERHGIEVIVSERRIQPWDPEIFRRMGIEPTEKQILVLKSAVHYRAAYGPMAKQIIEVDTPGLLSSNFTNFKYRHIKRPIFPLDE